MGVIQVLDKRTAELIAAGEVIERPSSVVKELVENAIDAGSTSVTVEIQNGGIRLIRVTDNGCGMAREDVRTAFLRHATSKVRTEADLDSIETLGFRGEALASICAVSQVELVTRRAEDEIGTRLLVEGGECGEPEDAGCAAGTTFFVRDLFYNVPARMKFLKKDVTEGNAIASLLDRLALSHPEVSFQFIREGVKKMQTPGDGQLLSAIVGVHGREFAEGLLPVDYTAKSVSVSGYISKPEQARASRAMEQFFINNRYIRSTTLLSALEEAYRNSIMAGKFPGCVLNVELPCGMVDVNVHPAKLEVKLADERMVFDAVYLACKTALAKMSNATRAADVPSARKLQEKLAAENAGDAVPGLKREPQLRMTAQEFQAAFGGNSDKKDAPEKKAVTSVKSALEMLSQRRPGWEKPAVRPQEAAEPETSIPPRSDAFTGEKEPPLRKETPPEPAQTEPKEPEKPAEVSCAGPETIPVREEEPSAVPLMPEPSIPDNIRLIGEVFRTYLLAEDGQEFYLIDKHAAHERILFEKMKEEHSRGGLDRQVLLSGERVVLSREQAEAILEHPEIAEKAGFVAEDFGGNAVIVREIPSVLGLEDIEPVLTELAEQIARNYTRISLRFYEDLFHSMACKAAIKGGWMTSRAEQEALLKTLAGDPRIRNCPHGRPVMISLSRRDLEKMFGRIV